MSHEVDGNGQHFPKVKVNSQIMYYFVNASPPKRGVQWLSGRVLDLRPRGRGFEPHRRHCIVVLEQDTFILA